MRKRARGREKTIKFLTRHTRTLATHFYVIAISDIVITKPRASLVNSLLDERRNPRARDYRCVRSENLHGIFTAFSSLFLF